MRVRAYVLTSSVASLSRARTCEKTLEAFAVESRHRDQLKTKHMPVAIH
jgi:hypothetical protein